MKAAPSLSWWWSADEERYHGPFTDRLTAILSAYFDDERGSVHVMQASQDGIRTSLFDAGQLAELFDEANEDLADPDGNEGLAAQIPDATWTELAERLNASIAGTVRRAGLTSWMFSETANAETVDLSGAPFAAIGPEARTEVAELVATLSGTMTPGDEGLLARLRDIRRLVRGDSQEPGQ